MLLHTNILEGPFVISCEASPLGAVRGHGGVHTEAGGVCTCDKYHFELTVILT